MYIQLYIIFLFKATKSEYRRNYLHLSVAWPTLADPFRIVYTEGSPPCILYVVEFYTRIPGVSWRYFCKCNKQIKKNSKDIEIKITNKLGE